MIENAIKRFENNALKVYNIDNTEDGVTLNINCSEQSQSSIPSLKMGESYSLTINNEIQLQAATNWGILRGLETILQLIQADESGNPYLPKLELKDQPAYPWRGLMVDVSRHWIPKEIILRIIDGMSAVKMNTFHWHLSDDQGFRVESTTFPKLHEIGSNGYYYTQDEIREVVRFAAERGIRVIPEFDIPGHTKSWQIAYPELSSVDHKLQFGKTKSEIFFPPMDPSKESLYLFLDRFIEEMATLFPDEYFHIGGDEVESSFWEENDRIQKYMTENDLQDAHELQAHFNKRVKELLQKHGKKMVGWQEIFNPELGNDIVIQSWINHKSLFEAVQSGASGILSNGWYLDLKLHAENYYSIDPLVIPNAIDIVPDSENWKMYDILINFSGNDLDGSMVLFDKEEENVYGFMELMNNMIVFRDGVKQNNQFSFEMVTPMGTLQFEGSLQEDELNGKLSLALLKFDCNGTLVGGSHMPGTSLPKIEIIKPLNDEEKTRVLGGESAMWSEVVGPDNVESRIWPSNAAIAEKLWSPAQLCTDVDDMYRRLSVFSEYLTRRGSPHAEQMNAILKPLIDPAGLTYLTTLVNLLEEVKYYGRLTPVMAMEELYLPELQLNRIVDAARPESFEARKFNNLVENYLLDLNPKNKEEIIQYLTRWSELDAKLSPFLKTDKLMEISEISKEFSFVSAEILTGLETEDLWSNKKVDTIQQKILFLENGEYEVTLAVAKGLGQLLTLKQNKETQ